MSQLRGELAFWDGKLEDAERTGGIGVHIAFAERVKVLAAMNRPKSHLESTLAFWEGELEKARRIGGNAVHIATKYRDQALAAMEGGGRSSAEGRTGNEARRRERKNAPSLETIPEEKDSERASTAAPADAQ